ncbi:MAG: hypothetical protein NTU41_13305 [Chloroflexi bacterium]|nr:hypothetical protein [Chloroflexota bacterium]
MEKEAARKPPGTVFISTVSDGWQPAEEKYGLTRRCLEVLLRHHFTPLIHTKSKLVERDFDLIRGHDDVELGVTLTTVDPQVAALFEPGASAPAERVNVIAGAKELGLRTFVFLGPLLPYISDRGGGLEAVLEAVRQLNPERLLVDRLNPRYGMWPATAAAVAAYDPDLVPAYRQLLYDGPTRERYTEGLRQRITGLAKRSGLLEKTELCF